MTTLLTMKGFNKQAQPITTAGIYRNSTKGVISLSSDGTTWITIADKNLGATQVYNNGDALSEDNCGKYFQWGNNYGFPFTGAITISSTQVDASNYGPGNYYNSNLFVTGAIYSTVNYNLWGGVTGTNEAMQGPCQSGFHIPTNTENGNIISILSSLGINVSNGNGLKIYLKMPYAGCVHTSYGTQYYQGTNGFYTSCIESSDYHAYQIYFTTSELIPDNGGAMSYGRSIRPFANTPVQPDDGGDWETLYTPPEILNFTANTAGSTVQLTQSGTPTVVSLETSTDGTNWTAYTIGDTITLSNIGDKVYWRNKSETTTGFSTGDTNRYQFVMTGTIAASGDVNYLINKNSTDTLVGDYCFNRLFYLCESLVTSPLVTATMTTTRCYQYMFYQCTNLEQLPSLQVTTFSNYCCFGMFGNCTKIKLSTTQTGEYVNEYRIPITGTGTEGTSSFNNMFNNTGGTFTGTPTINTTYYTSNQVI